MTTENSEAEKYRRFVLDKLQSEQQVTDRKTWRCSIEGCETKTNLLFIHPDGEYPEPYCKKCADEEEMREYPEDIVDAED